MSVSVSEGELEGEGRWMYERVGVFDDVVR